MRLLLDLGYSDRTPRPDTAGGRSLALGPESHHAQSAVLLACVANADGSVNGSAATAAAALVNGFGAADDEAPQTALAEALTAANGAARAVEEARPAVVAAMVLRERRWCIAHAGNARVWRYRDLQLRQLTRDHVVPRALGAVELTRACGLAPQLEPEFGTGDLREGDVFLLTTPAVHDAIPGAALLGLLQSGAPAQEMADAVVQRAIASHARGYAGACVVRVDKLPLRGTTQREEALPVIEPPAPDAELDGFIVRKLVHDDGAFRLYRADDRESGHPVLLRFPVPGNGRAAQQLQREERLGRRLASPYVLEPLPLRAQRRTALYSVLEYRSLESLSHRIKRKQALPLPEALELGGHLLAALEALHAQGVVHGAIRARALFHDRRARRLLLLALGQADSGKDTRGEDRPDASFCAPEVLADAPATERSDIYATGVTIYYMLTGRYPYGRIRSSGDWKVSRAYRPLERPGLTVPPALDEALERACARDPARRYASAAQFAAALDAVRVQQPASAEPARGGERWGLWAAAVLGAALLVYLYLTLG